MIEVHFFDKFGREEIAKIALEKFGDNTLKCYAGDANSQYGFDYFVNLCNHHVKIVWCYDDDTELFALYCIVKELKNLASNIPISLFMPYIPHARQDRHVSNRLFTLKYFTEIINSLNFEKVTVVDPHSDVSTALLDRCEVLYPFPSVISSNQVWMYPDNGAAKKYSSIGIICPNNYIVGNKKRNSEGRIEKYELVNFPEGTKEVWIRDDICSYGGTFVAAAKALREHGVEKIHLVLSHCENNIHKGEVFKYIDDIYTTDSLYFEPHEKIHIYRNYRNIQGGNYEN